MSLHLLVGYKDGQNIVSCSEGKLLCCSQFVTPHAIIGCTTTLLVCYMQHRYTHTCTLSNADTHAVCLQYAKHTPVFPHILLHKYNAIPTHYILHTSLHQNDDYTLSVLILNYSVYHHHHHHTKQHLLLQ